MITITLEAKYLINMEARKPSGQKVYTVKDKIQVHGMPSFKDFTSNGVVFLHSEGSINAVPESTKLSVDFETPGDVIQFMENIESAED